MSKELTLDSIDDILDFSAEIINTVSKAKTRDRNFEKDVAEGEHHCEVCGRHLKISAPSTFLVKFEDGRKPTYVGPTCGKKIIKLLAE